MKKNSETQAGLEGVNFQWFLESAADGIIIVNAEGRILLVNNQAEKMFGYTSDEMVGKTVETLIPERYHEVHVEHRVDYVAAPRTRPMGIGLELYGRRRDGSDFPVEISLSPVHTEHGLLVMAIIRDVTEFRRERYISSTLQKSLLSVTPEKVCGLTVASEYHSAYTESQVGGDFFDVLCLGDESIGIVIGDVSGKGVEAAVRTALAKYTLRAYVYVDPEPRPVIAKVNTAVHNQIGIESFITLFYGLVNVTNRTLTFSNAGHMPPLYLPCSRDDVQELEGANIPLGIVPGEEFDQHAVEFREGDRILLYTDGVVEARGEEGFFGVENLKEFFLSGRHEQPKEFVKHLVARLREWSGQQLQDDVAVLVVSWE